MAAPVPARSKQVVPISKTWVTLQFGGQPLIILHDLEMLIGGAKR